MKKTLLAIALAVLSVAAFAQAGGNPGYAYWVVYPEYGGAKPSDACNAGAQSGWVAGGSAVPAQSYMNFDANGRPYTDCMSEYAGGFYSVIKKSGAPLLWSEYLAMPPSMR